MAAILEDPLKKKPDPNLPPDPNPPPEPPPDPNAPPAEPPPTEWIPGQNINKALSAGATRRAERASDWGFNAAATRRADRAATWAERSGDPAAVEAAAAAGEEVKAETTQDQQDLGDLSQAKYVSDPEQLQAWKDSADAIATVNTDYTGPTSTSVVSGLKPGEESIVGTKYAGDETAMLAASSDIMNQDAAVLGQNINTLTDTLQQGKTATEKAADTQTEAALQGKLTAADSEWYQNQSAVLDQATQKQLDSLDEQISLQGIGAGKANQLKSDVLSEARNQKNSILSGLQSQAASKAIDYASQSRSQMNDFVKSMASTTLQSDANKNTAVSNTASYLSNVAKAENEQRALQLNEQQANVRNQMEAAFKTIDANLNKAKTVSEAEGSISQFEENRYWENQKIVYDQTVGGVMDGITTFLNFLNTVLPVVKA